MWEVIIAFISIPFKPSDTLRYVCDLLVGKYGNTFYTGIGDKQTIPI